MRLRVVVRGVSPLIVRTLVVSSSSTLDVLYRALLACFGWSGERQHVFAIRAVFYSACWQIGAEDGRDVTLAALGLRAGERFTWSYDFLDGWVVDVRVEDVTAGVDVDVVPPIWCVAGRRAGPLEGCGGVGGFYRWEDQYSLFEFLERVDEVVDGVDGYGRPVDEMVAVAELRRVARWMVRDRFDKADLNRRLAALEVRSCVSSSKSG